jgi:alcohol dehydrogenase (cytochrome c)
MYKFKFELVRYGVAFALAAYPLNAQGLDPAALLKPLTDSWPSYHGDYTGRRHSPLAQITPANVEQLGLAWIFQSRQNATIKSSPLMVNGIIYFTVPDNVWAVDARSGHEIWRYTYPQNKGLHIGSRGVSMWHDSLYFMTPDAHVVCLNARDGKVKWNIEVADVKKGYWSSMPPLIVGNHVISGVSGDFDNLQGILKSLDAETGKVQWEWNSTPPAGAPNQPTGGQSWITGTYDPELNLVYFGTGNPTPVLTASSRPGDDLYTCSIVALNPDTGKLVWAFQPSPHDTHDWDAVEIPVLVDRDFAGQPRKMLMQASRNGFFFVLDRTNGKSLLTVPFGPVNWTSGLDAKGQPIPNPAKEPAPDGRLVSPDEGGMTNYRSPSFDPQTGLFIVSARVAYGVYFAKPKDGTYGWAGADYYVWGKGVLQAIDYNTGKPRWTHELGPNGASAGVLTTASGLTFTGDAAGNLLALETATGKVLWHANTGSSVDTPPVTYELDGRQYVLTGSGGILTSWVLPKSVVARGGK